MKFSFSKFGAIDDAEVEVFPLTVICGRNNTGKTYVSYAIYSLLAKWRELISWRISESDVVALLSNGTVSVNIKEEIVDNWIAIQKRTNENWKKTISQALAANSDRFKETKISFALDIDDKWKTIPFKRDFRSDEGKILFSAEKIEGGDLVEIAFLKDNALTELPRYALEEFVSQALLDSVLSPYFRPVFMLSTERTGAVTFKDELNLTKNRLVNFLAGLDSGHERGTINPAGLFDAVYKLAYPLPVENNVLFVNRLGSLEGTTNTLLTAHPELIDQFEAIAGGRYETNKEGLTQFLPKGSSTKLQMREASSAVRSLVLFWYWMKSQATSESMLLIDEPELNLHPENQRAFARLLCQLVKHGVRVLVTTHSDTMLREFNTLIMLSRNKEHFSAIRKRYGYLEDESLAPSDVRLYVAVGRSLTGTGRPKKGSFSTLKPIAPDSNIGLVAEIFDSTIMEMNSIQDEIRYGVI